MNLWSFLLVTFFVLVGVDFWLLYQARNGDDAANFILGLSVASTFIVVGFFMSELSQWLASRRIQAQQELYRTKESAAELYQNQRVMGRQVSDMLKLSQGMLRLLPSPGHEEKPFNIDDDSVWDESGLEIYNDLDNLNIEGLEANP